MAWINDEEGPPPLVPLADLHCYLNLPGFLSVVDSLRHINDSRWKHLVRAAIFLAGELECSVNTGS